MIRPETIQAILDACRIEEVVGDFVSLKKRGVNMIGLCPFHNEKTPSFTVSPVKGIYKCFGCSKAGNAVGFIMEHEHYTYPEALRYLAKKYHIDIEETAPDPQEVQAQNEKESLFQINAFAQKLFTDFLHDTEEGRAIGLSYFKERLFTTDIIKKFQLGYSPAQWDFFTKAALEAGYQKEFLLKSGLSIDKDGRLYDRFRERVMFPIHNQSGRVIGFTGRILTAEKDKPKYVNSPESEIYNKSRSLYGVYFARNEIAKKDECLLVEGNADVLAMFQSGIENVVASSGTSLTTDQIRMIKRYTRNITILYDGDPAGIKAAIRGTEMILEEDMDVRIVLFPEGDDPDSYARKHRPAELLDFIHKNAVNFISFKAKLLMQETRNDPIKTAGLIKEIVRTISIIPDAIARNLYIRQCSQLMSVPEQTLTNELNRLLRKRLAKKEPEVKEEDIPEEVIPDQGVMFDPFDSYDQERYIVQLLINYGSLEINVEEEEKEGASRNLSVAEFLIKDFKEDDLHFEDPVFARIFDEFVVKLDGGTVPDEQYFINYPESEIARVCIDLISSPYVLSRNWMDRHHIQVPTRDDDNRRILIQDLIESVTAIRSRRIEKMIRDNQLELRQAQEVKNDEDVLICLAKDKELKGIYIKLNQILGRIIPR